MHTKDLLAEALMQIGLFDMSLQARGGYYHDFLSPLATPEIQLINDLAQAAGTATDRDRRDAILAVRQRVINGDFDATKEKSDEWASSPDGQDTLGRLINDGKQRAEDHPDDSVQEVYAAQMTGTIKAVDELFNGEDTGKDRKVAVVLMVFPFGDTGRFNYMSNGVHRGDMVTLMKEMIARFEGQPEQTEGRA